jgi:hypothetical protein
MTRKPVEAGDTGDDGIRIGVSIRGVSITGVSIRGVSIRGVSDSHVSVRMSGVSMSRRKSKKQLFLNLILKEEILFQSDSILARLLHSQTSRPCMVKQRN